jgi:hypothetical protein
MEAEAALTWEPATLNFGVAFDKPSMQELQGRNASPKNVAYAFKVKTTNPKRYSVRPSVGVVWPSKEITVTVQLFAMKEYPSDTSECKDKFKLLMLPLKPEMAERLKSVSRDQQRKELTVLWASDAAKYAVVDKIRCAMTFDSSFRGAPIAEEEHPIPPCAPPPGPPSSPRSPSSSWAEKVTLAAWTPAQSVSAAHVPSLEHESVERATRPSPSHVWATQLTSEPEPVPASGALSSSSSSSSSLSSSSSSSSSISAFMTAGLAVASAAGLAAGLAAGATRWLLGSSSPVSTGTPDGFPVDEAQAEAAREAERLHAQRAGAMLMAWQAQASFNERTRARGYAALLLGLMMLAIGMALSVESLVRQRPQMPAVPFLRYSAAIF